MASTQQLKRRITSVKNTKQITKAMELVAASKMRRAQELTLRSRSYRNLARAILTRLRELTDVSNHPLYAHRPIKSHLYIAITSDRGLAGSYNTNLTKHVVRVIQNNQKQDINTRLIVVGRQGSKVLSRIDGVDIIAVYDNFAEQPTANDIRPLLHSIVHMYTDKDIDAVNVIFTDYRSSVNQVVVSECLLPAAFETISVPPDLERATFEPSAEAVLDNITQRLVESQLTQAFLESRASEHSMRMMAMKNATDNATELADDLTLAFNTARQSAITQELAEITGGAAAIK